MAREKQSNWQPKGIELWEEVDQFYDDDLFRKLATEIGQMPESMLPEFKDKVLWVAAILHGELYYELRPTHKRKRQALDRLRSTVHKVEDTLDNLDADTRKLLYQAALDDERYRRSSGDQIGPRQEHELEWNPTNFGSLGTILLGRAEAEIKNLLRWIDSTTFDLRKNKGGRPPTEAKQEAVRSLLSIWQVYCDLLNSDLRTKKKFHFFAEVALKPLLKHYQLNLSVTDQVNAVYGTRTENRP